MRIYLELKSTYIPSHGSVKASAIHQRDRN